MEHAYEQLEMPLLVLSEEAAKAVDSYRSKVSKRKQAMDDARAELGAVYSKAEDDGINKAAFKLAMKIEAMDPAKAKAFVSSLTAYLHRFGTLERIEKFNDAEDSESEAAEDQGRKRRGRARANGHAAHADA